MRLGDVRELDRALVGALARGDFRRALQMLGSREVQAEIVQT